MRREPKSWQREGDSTPRVAGFEDGGRGPPATECRPPSEAKKGKEMDYPLDPPVGSAALWTLWFFLNLKPPEP